MSSKLTLVLLPGLDGTGLLFEPFIAMLGEYFKDVIVAQYPQEGSQKYEHLTEYAREIIPKEHPCVILGESFSGPIAISIAASSSNVKGVILCCTFAKNPRPLLLKLRFFTYFFPFKFIPKILISTFLLGNNAPKVLRNLLIKTLSKISQKTLQARLRAVSSINVFSELKKLTAPVLYLKAKQDLVIPAGVFTQISEARPTTHLQEFDAPHLLLQVLPEKAADVVKKFFVV